VKIALLARLVWPGESLKAFILAGKKTGAKYIEGYNACDGQKTVSELARIVGVSQPNMTMILKKWEQKEVVYNVGGKGRPLYKRIMFVG